MVRWSGRTVLLGTALALGTVLGLAYVAYRQVDELLEVQRQVSRHQDALRELDQLLGSLVEAEAAVRGYALDGEAAHLGPYHAARVGVDRRLRRLAELTFPDPAAEELLALVRPRVAERLALLQETVEARARHGAEGAWQSLPARGRERMEALRHPLAALGLAQGQLLHRRQARQALLLQQVIVALAALSSAVGATVGLAGAALRRELDRRRRTEEALERATAKLAGWARDLDQRGREITILGEMGDVLQRARTLTEACGVVGDFAPRLFPGSSGLLGLLDAPRSFVEAAAKWGVALDADPAFQPAACWALRRQRPHLADDAGTGLLCGHVHPTVPTGYFCLPLLAQGEPIGVLYLQLPPEEPGREPEAPHVREARRHLALSVAHQVELSLANLRLQEHLRGQVIRDPLTNLYNRRYMEESLAREVRRARRAGTPLGIIMLDIDHFKRFNDTHGHDAGDALLRAVAVFLQSHVRGEDIACRYGGEEFILILPGAPVAISLQRAEYLRQGVQDLSVEHEGRLLGPVTLSLGVAVFPDHGPSGDAVLRAADSALYRAKAEGRNRVVVAT